MTADRTPNTPQRDQQEDLRVNGSDSRSVQGSWQYNGENRRSRGRSYSGHVTYIGGAEGERLRDALAAVSRDLLDWAASAEDAAVKPPDHHEHGEAA